MPVIAFCDYERIALTSVYSNETQIDINITCNILTLMFVLMPLLELTMLSWNFFVCSALKRTSVNMEWRPTQASQPQPTEFISEQHGSSTSGSSFFHGYRLIILPGPIESFHPSAHHGHQRLQALPPQFRALQPARIRPR